MSLVSSAEAHPNADDLDLACRTGSVRSIHTIRSARKVMSRYHRDPRVQKLDRHLAYLAA